MARLAGLLLLLVVGMAALWTGCAAAGSGSSMASPAELVIVPANTTATEGNTLILVCVGYGEPSPEVVWLKDGMELANDSRVTVFTELVVEQGVEFVQTTLEICSLNVTEDSGVYYCNASNDFGSAMSAFDITVQPAERVEIVIQPDDGSFTEGNTAIFTCVAFGDPDSPNITWWRNGEELYNSSYVDDDEGSIRIYQEVLEVGGATFVVSNLEICGITMEDTGVYVCSAQLSSVSATSEVFRVNVTSASPEIVIAPANTDVVAGNTAIFTCVGLSVPPPDITWTFGGEIITNDSRISVYNEEVVENGVMFSVSFLELCGVMAEDSGTYSCVATGATANTTAYFQLNVVEQNGPEIVIAPPNTTVDVNNTALFTCVALAGSVSSDTNISWTRGGEPLTNDSRVTVYITPINEGGGVFIHSILEICGVTLEDTDYYTCVAENGYGYDYSSFIVEVVDTGPPDIVIAPSDTDVLLGNTVLFTCVVAFLNTPPELSWHRNDTGKLYNTSEISIYTSTIEESGVTFLRSILEVCGVELSDEGLYFCQAAYDMNPDRTARAYFYVDVLEPQEEVEIVIAPADFAATANSTVLFTCVVYGLPLPSYVTWTFNNTLLYNSTSDNYTLTIYHSQFEVNGAVFLQSILEICGVVEEQAGNYSCSAESSAGNDTESFLLVVQPLVPPEIVIAPKALVRVDEGNTVLLTCVALGYPRPYITWSNSYSGTTYGNGTVTDRHRVTESVVTQSGVEFVTSVFEICGVEFEDAGEYSCVAASGSGTSYVQFNISVVEPLAAPAIAIAPNDTEADINSTVIFVCVAYGNPLPNISWVFEYSDLMNDSTVSIFTDEFTESGVTFVRTFLQLCGVTVDNQGLYSCVAENSLNYTSSSFYLNILEPPMVAIQPEDTLANYGDTVLLVCVVFSQDPRPYIPPNVLWYHDNELVTNYTSGDDNDGASVAIYEDTFEEMGVTFTRSVLELCGVTLEEEGDYSCVANDSIGTSRPASFNISVFTNVTVVIAPADEDIYAGVTVLFTCVATGIPDPTFSWYLGNSPITEGDRHNITTVTEVIDGVTFVSSVLQICEVDFNDTGTYRCVAMVPRLSDSASFEVLVQGIAAEISEGPMDITVVRGTEVTLTCEARGAPVPTVTWTRDGGVTAVGTVTNSVFELIYVNSTLELGPVDETTVYVCTADNDAVDGNPTAAATVIVQIPVAVETSPMNMTIVVGDTVTFSCSFSGYPAPTIQWFEERNPGSPLSDGTKYTITTTSGNGLSSELIFMTEVSDHNTAYFCRAMQTLVTGDVSEITMSAFLTILSPPQLEPRNLILPAIENGTQYLTFNILNALPPVTEDGVAWFFRPSETMESSGMSESSGGAAESFEIDSDTSDRYNFMFVADADPPYVRLRIRPVQQDDEGNYTLFVENIVGNDSFTVSVEVFIGAYIVDPPNDTTVHVGLNATFRCVATSDPPHNTVWLFNDTDLMDGDKYMIVDESDAVSVLTVLDVVGEDDGEYTCAVMNEHGNDTAYAVLTVISTPVVEAATPSPVIALPGQSRTLSFSVTNSLPPVMVETSDWRQVLADESMHTIASEDIDFTFLDDNTALTISNIHPADEATYVLTVTNSAGLSDSASIELDVQFAASIQTLPEDAAALVGEDATFTCVAMGEPTPAITWVFNDQDLSNSTKYTITEVLGSVKVNSTLIVTVQSTLVVMGVEEGDAGSYTCRAENTHMVVMASASLQPLRAPVVTLMSMPDPALRDNQLTLTATITMDLPPVAPDGITWYFMDDVGSGAGGDLPDDVMGTEIVEDDEIMFSDDRRTLTISPLSYSNEGFYTVRVMNAFGDFMGSDTDSVFVDVQAAPQVGITLFPERSVEGTMVTVVCDVIAEPEADVSFTGPVLNAPNQRYSISVRTFTGSRYYMSEHNLTFTDVMTTDEGNYACTANNTHGSVTSQPVTLVVLVLPEVMADRGLYQFVAGQPGVSISFTTSGRENPRLMSDGVTVWFQNMEGIVSQVVDSQVMLSGPDDNVVMQVTVMFSEVGIQDNGTYWVTATNEAGTTNSTPATVEVFVNPTIRTEGELMQVLNELESVMFSCVATGNPSPSFTWTRNGQFLPITSSARFEASSESDGVRAENGSIMTVGYLRIVNLTVGDSAPYACGASIGVDLPAAVNVIVDVPFTLTVNEIQIDDCAPRPCVNGECRDVGDGFVCVCPEGFNGLLCGNPVVELAAPELIQQPQTMFVDIETTVVFTCVATGNPQPTIQWWYEGEALVEQVLENLEIQGASLEDRGDYFCTATNSEGTVQSVIIVLNFDDIVQFVLVIRLDGTFDSASRRKRFTAQDLQNLVAMLNEQLTGTMIGNATVYSVAIQDGFDITQNPGGDIPLIFTFFAEDDDDAPVTTPDPTDPNEPTVPIAPEVVAMFNVAEIERIIEEDVMLAAEELGLNVTVEEFLRFDGCGIDETILFDDRFSWEETSIGGIRSLPCRCDALNLGRSATRECGGNFTTGAVWSSPMDNACDFGPVTRQLCSSPELDVIQNLQLDTLDSLGVAVVTELLEGFVSASSGNETESDVIFDVIEDVLRVQAGQLVSGQLEFNTSGRLLYSLEVLADAYPSPSSIVQYVTRDPFRFILIPASFLTTTVHTLTVTQDNSLQLGPAEQARVRVDLPSMAGTQGLTAGVYNSPSLFVSRPEYVRAQNRSNYVLGSNVGVITVHFSGSLARTELDEPVEIRFWKTDEASQNGTETECAFWDQSLDEGYGAWSGDECVLERETSEFADCACTHLTQFTLLVDVTPEPPTPSVTPIVEREEEDDSIEEGSYVGGLVCIVFLVIIIITYLLNSDLRKSPMGVSLINSSVCLSALFISYLISYYTAEDDWACTIFSAVFHYIFLVVSISLLILALLKTWAPEKLTKIFIGLLLVQFIFPAVVVIISAAPDRDNYFNDEFCRPQREPYWYGLLLVGGLIHILAWLFLFTGLCVVHIRREKISTQWFEEWLGVALTLAVFELAWGFGLPSTNTLGLGATRLVFQIIFLVGCIVLGVIELVFFVVLLREPRGVWTGLVNRCIPGRSGGFDTTTYGVRIEENPYVAQGEGGSIEMSGVVPGKAAPKYDDEVSAAKRTPEAAVMTERLNGEDPEAIVNPTATEQDDEDGGPEMETTEVKMDFGTYDDDADAGKDTKL